MDYTALTAAIDFGTALTAIGTVAVAVGGLYLGIRGARMVLSFVRK
jgi:hypothetical protein